MFCKHCIPICDLSLLPLIIIMLKTYIAFMMLSKILEDEVTEDKVTLNVYIDLRDNIPKYWIFQSLRSSVFLYSFKYFIIF